MNKIVYRTFSTVTKKSCEPRDEKKTPKEWLERMRNVAIAAKRPSKIVQYSTQGNVITLGHCLSITTSGRPLKNTTWKCSL